MKTKIENHPTITLHDEITTLCSPLHKLGITYFCQATIQDNQFSAIATNPDFHRYYLNNNYQNADIHMAKEHSDQKYIIWDDIICNGKSAELDDASMKFGIHHTFTLHSKDNAGDHFYHFATSHRRPDFNYVYLHNLDLLNLFVNKFKMTTQQSSALSDAYEIKYSIDDNQSDFDLENLLIPPSFHDRNEFLIALWKDKKFPLTNGTSLSFRQLLILYWLYHGKTIADIAQILGLADITLHKQINQLKAQVNCYTQFQLGVFFSGLAGDVKSIILLIEKECLRAGS